MLGLEELLQLLIECGHSHGQREGTSALLCEGEQHPRPTSPSLAKYGSLLDEAHVHELFESCVHGPSREMTQLSAAFGLILEPLQRCNLVVG